MRIRIAKKFMLFLNIIFILLFSIGMYIYTYFEDDYKWIGIICQVSTLIYTVIFSVNSIFIDNDYEHDLLPTIFFTDREETISKTLNSLYKIICLNSQEQIIPIVCEEKRGSGKTEILLKLRQLLLDKHEAKIRLCLNDYKYYKKIKSRLGRVYLIQYHGEGTITQINRLPYTLFKKDVVIVDNLPHVALNKFDSKFIVVYCQKDQEKLKDNSQELIKLLTFSNYDIQKLYKLKFNEDIEKHLLNRVKEYSQGNISTITQLFSSKKSIQDFIDNSGIIYELEQSLDAGNYREARNKIDNLASSQKSSLQKNDEYFYKFKFIEADLFHLQNRYNESYEMFEILRAEYMNDDVKHMEIIDKICHIKKHMGRFKDALNEVNYLPSQISVQRALSLNLLAYTHYEKKNYLLDAKKLLLTIEENKNNFITKDKDSYHTYKAVTCAYEHKYSIAHVMIDKAISLYEENDSRFVTNCYFIKGEIYRHENKFVEACKSYQKCLNSYRFNNDFDVYSMSFTLLTFVTQIYDISHIFDITMNLEMTKSKCTDLDMNYNKSIVMLLDELLKLRNKKNDEKYEKIKNYFDGYIFFIP